MPETSSDVQGEAGFAPAGKCFRNVPPAAGKPLHDGPAGRDIPCHDHDINHVIEPDFLTLPRLVRAHRRVVQLNPAKCAVRSVNEIILEWRGYDGVNPERSRGFSTGFGLERKERI